MEIDTLNYCETLSFWVDNNILFGKLNQTNCYLTDEAVEVYLSKIEFLTQGTPLPFILDIGKFVGNFSPSAAKLFGASPISKSGIINQAFVANTLNGKLLVRSYMRIYGQEADIKIFEQVESAVAYCIEAQKKFNGENGK